MKLIKYEVELKTVGYYGIQFNIDSKFNYIATDEDGFVFAYENEPHINMALKDCWMYNAIDYNGGYALIGLVDLEGLYFGDTLKGI
jgi:hypothetical protein